MSDAPASARRGGGIPWGRIIAEALLIFGSVYLAIFLEGRSQDRREEREAREALVQLLLELHADEVNLAEIQRSQLAISQEYLRINRWLGDPASVPGDSLTASLNFVTTDNRTLFPRKGAWNTMVAAGQLVDLDNPELVTRLANLYENVVPRLEYNGRYYDADLSMITNQVIVGTWDSYNRRFSPGGEVEMVRLREAILRLYNGWNLYYLDLLDEYEDLLESSTAAIEAFLGAEIEASR
ncbi:MAG: DUF6090 family protein [Gemmatimonadota bacterium]|nr:DUF6090 family protein [Gemmatimonadota bacterium]